MKKIAMAVHGGAGSCSSFLRLHAKDIEKGLKIALEQGYDFTGEGEYLISGMIAHTIAMMVEGKMQLKKACEEVIHQRNKNTGEMGVIALNREGEIAVAFNTEIMKRAWIDEKGQLHLSIF